MSTSLFPVTVDDYRSSLSPGSMATFNVNDGYLEGILRGYMLGLLTRVDYGNLVQCDTLEGTTLSFFPAFPAPCSRVLILTLFAPRFLQLSNSLVRF